MNRISLLLIGFFSFPLLANVDAITLRNYDQNFGVCQNSEDLGNWGYTLQSVDAQQELDKVYVRVTILNLTCKEASSKKNAMEWHISPPRPNLPEDKISEELQFAGVSGLLFEADSIRKAQFTAPGAILPIQTYSFTWEKRGLQESLDRLERGKTHSLKLVFGLRAFYENSGNDSLMYQSFSGRYGLYLDWHNVEGLVALESSIKNL